MNTIQYDANFDKKIDGNRLINVSASDPTSLIQTDRDYQNQSKNPEMHEES